MEMRQVVTGTLAWVGLVVVVAVPATEALVSRLTQPQAGQAIETIAPVAASIAAPKSPVTSQIATAPAAAQVLPPIQPKPVVARLRPDPKPVPVVASTIAAPAIKPASAEKPLPQFSAARLETSSADDRVMPPVESGGHELPAKIADLPAAPKSNVAPAVSPIAPTAKLATSVADKPVVEASAAGTDLPPVAPAATPETVIDSAAAPAAATAQSEVRMATTAAQNAPSASPDAAMPPAAPPVPMPVSARPKEAPTKLVTADDLKGWKSGSLADYLKQQGLAESGDAGPGDSN